MSYDVIAKKKAPIINKRQLKIKTFLSIIVKISCDCTLRHEITSTDFVFVPPKVS